jgi:hypothetical protein
MDTSKGLFSVSGCKEESTDHVPFEHLRQHFHSPFSELQGDYLRTLRNWNSHFPASQILVGFLEEIEASPVRFLNRVSAFLGIEPAPAHGWPHAEHRVNAQQAQLMPSEVARYLSRKFYFYIRDLEKHPVLENNDFVKAWRQDAERHLDCVAS